MEGGVVSGKPNYLIIYGEGCFNSKRQARRTVSLYQRYPGRVNFVIIDLDRKRGPEQQELLRTYYKGYIPHVVVMDKATATIYNRSGEVDEASVAKLFDAALQ